MEFNQKLTNLLKENWRPEVAIRNIIREFPQFRDLKYEIILTEKDRVGKFYRNDMRNAIIDTAEHFNNIEERRTTILNEFDNQKSIDIESSCKYIHKYIRIPSLIKQLPYYSDISYYLYRLFLRIKEKNQNAIINGLANIGYSTENIDIL